MVKIQLETLRSEGKSLGNETTKRLDSLHQDITNLIQAMSSKAPQYGSNPINKDLKDESLVRLGEALSNFHSTTRSMSWQNHILSRLVFPSMYRRGDSIEDPESGTFTWMVEEESDTDEESETDEYYGSEDDFGSEFDPADALEKQERMENRRLEKEWMEEQRAMRDNTRQQFLTWLNSGSQIFHISGKAGSGKSTLMKFLADSPRVQHELEHWTGGKRLILSRFFFWNSGDKLQMSLEGLYRSLLFETCIQCPDLIPRTFPTLWEEVSSGAAPPQQTPMRFEEIKAAFGRLIKESQSFDAYFCFWIDGLDEFEGDEVDHWHLARDLQRWTESKHIKLCVSSRPHVPFMQTFSVDMNQQISIHELTIEDIRRFSVAMFENDPNFHRVKDSYQELISRVIEDANGVFLWARLVVRSLLKSIGYQSTAKGLEKKLNSMPKGLDELFDQILNSIDPDDQPLSDKLFLMSTERFPSAGYSLPIGNAMAYSRLEDLDDPGFPENRPMRVYSIAEIDEQLSRVPCILDRFSRGLLEMKTNRVHERHDHGYFSYDVDFLHRTVRDYLVNTRRDQMRSRVPEFDAQVGIIQLLLADYKFARPTNEDLIPQSNAFHSPIRSQFVFLCHCLSKVGQSGKTDILPGFLEQAFEVTTFHAQPADFVDEQQHQYRNTRYLLGQAREVDHHGIGYHTRQSNHPPCFLCETMESELCSHLPPRLLARLKQENLTSGPNLLLVAATQDQVGLVGELLLEGRSPLEMVAMERMDSRLTNEVSETIATPKGFASVWLLLMYDYARIFFAGWPTSEAQVLILKSFLDWGTDPDVEFILREQMPRGDSRDNLALKESPESPTSYILNLLELSEIIAPPNLDVIRPKLISRSPNTDRRDLFDHVYRKEKPHSAFYIESIVTPTERLDIPFRYRVN